MGQNGRLLIAGNSIANFLWDVITHLQKKVQVIFISERDMELSSVQPKILNYNLNHDENSDHYSRMFGISIHHPKW